MQFSLIPILLAWGTASSLAASATTPSPSIAIICPAPHGSTVGHAAEELARYAQLLTGRAAVRAASFNTAPVGCSVALVGGPKDNPEVARLSEQGLLSVDWESLGQDGYVVQSLSLEGQPRSTLYAPRPTILLAGATGRATLYAVYDYLQRDCDVGFFMDGDRVPHLRELPAAEIHRIERPYFAFRDGISFGLGYAGHWKYDPYYWPYERVAAGFDWMAKRRLNWTAITLNPSLNASGDVLDMVFPDLPPLEQGPFYRGGWPVGWDWPPAYRRQLNQHILRYARGIGLRVWYGFDTQLFPERLAKAHPELPFLPTEAAGYGTTTQIDPRDPRGIELQEAWARKAIEVFGTDHYYMATPYAEGSPGRTLEENRETRMAAAQSHLEVIQEIDPQAIWFTDSWAYYAKDVFTPEFLKRYLDAVPKDRMYLYDTGADIMRTPLYKRFEGFYGKNFALGILQAYGGSDLPFGNLQHLIDLTQEVTRIPEGRTCNGIVTCPEISGAAELLWDLVAELQWDPRDVRLEDFLADHTRRRYGKESYALLRPAVDLFVRARYEQPLISIAGGEAQWHVPDDPFYSFPYLGFGSPIGWPFNYENEKWIPPRKARTERTVPLLRAALRQMLLAEDLQRDNPLWENDVIDIARCYLGALSDLHFIQTYEAFRDGDRLRMDREAEAALACVRELERILSTRPDFCLAPMLKAVMSVPGTNPGTPEMIRTGCIVADYASRDVAEQLRDYNIPLLKEQIGILRRKLDAGARAIAQEEQSNYRVPELVAIRDAWVKNPTRPDRLGSGLTPVQAVWRALRETDRISRSSD